MGAFATVHLKVVMATSFHLALARKQRLDHIFETVAALSQVHGDYPVSQMSLVSAIANAVEPFHPPDDIATFNACIAAANLLLEAAFRPRAIPEGRCSPDQWWLSDDTGLSSRYLCWLLFPYVSSSRPPVVHPGDSADFGRCVRMVEATGSLDRISTLQCDSPAWAVLLRDWSHWVSLYKANTDEFSVKYLSEINEALKRGGYVT